MSRDHAYEQTSARERVLALLADLRWHGWRQLRAVGGVRYSARLLELRRLGYRTETQPTEGGKLYRLASLQRGEPQAKRVKVFLREADAELLLEGIVSASAGYRLREALASFRENKDRL